MRELLSLLPYVESLEDERKLVVVGLRRIARIVATSPLHRLW